MKHYMMLRVIVVARKFKELDEILEKLAKEKLQTKSAILRRLVAKGLLRRVLQNITVFSFTLLSRVLREEKT